jgi:GNAT superfamily N-acetyltransferase
VLKYGRPSGLGCECINLESAMTDDLQLISVTSEKVDLVAPLFDDYRQFYGQTTDLEGARQFLFERLQRGESVIFAVIEGENALGFTQLYPSFSSVSMQPIWILNDLFVGEKARRRGIGARLLMAAGDYAVRSGAVRLELSTAVENVTAQALYEQQGWQKDTDFFHYKFELPRDNNNSSRAK